MASNVVSQDRKYRGVLTVMGANTLAAIDMGRLSNGRFVLGLGTSVSAWTSGILWARSLS